MTLIEQMRQELVQRLERRSEPRTFDDRQVIVASDGVRPFVGSATALDWSSRGLRIKHNLPLRRDDLVKVITPERTALARVVWFMEMEEGREAGLLFTQEADWLREAINGKSQ